VEHNTKKQGVPVSTRALVQRINRVLAGQTRKLKRTRGGRAIQDLGEWYVIEAAKNFVLAKRVDPEEMGRELGALAPFEFMVD
jgi:hypothetical protein